MSGSSPASSTNLNSSAGTACAHEMLDSRPSIHFFRFATLRHPEHSEVIQRVLAIPPKRFDRALISFLTRTEVDALLASPDRSTWTGRRDHALLLLAVQTGLRASELTGLLCGDIHLGNGPHVSCRGKGRKDRITPLNAGAVAVLRVWLRERARHAERTALRGPRRRSAEPRRPRRPHSEVRGRSRRAVPNLADEADLSSHAEAYSRHATSACRRRHLGHRVVARPRAGRHHPDLSTCRSRHQGAGPREDKAIVNQPRSVPTVRLAARLPEGALIMPSSMRQTGRRGFGSLSTTCGAPSPPS